MNWLLIIIVLLLALCVVNGYRKGFLRMMYSMVSWVIMFALVTWATPYINTFLMDNTSIYQTIAVYCEQQIREKTEKQIEQEAAAVPGEAADETQPAAGQQAEGVEQYLRKNSRPCRGSIRCFRNLCEGFRWNGRFYFKWNFIFYCICCWDDRVAFFFRNTWYCIKDSDYSWNQQVSRNCCGSHIRLCGCLDCFLCDSALQYQ